MAKSKKQLRYPLTRIESNSDYLSINVCKYNPPGFTGGNTADTMFDIPSSTSIGGGGNCSKKSIEGNILLPMPDSIVDSNITNWESNEINSVAASAIGSIKQGLEEFTLDSMINSPGKKLTDGLARAQTTASNALDAAKDPAVSAALENYFIGNAVNLFGANVDATSLLSREKGLVLNPNMEFLFKGVQLRSFDFTFVMNPRSRQESIEVKSIINTFKKRMAAKSSAEGSGPRGLFVKAPDVFELQFKRGSSKHPFLYTMKTCALTKMTVDYMRTGNYITYEDSTPVQLAMALSFTELNPIYAEDYDMNNLPGADEGVGF
ncbi:baseplate tail tube cap [Synechococcus phage ACG-2014f]|uniref:Baseplate tail tube cap n=1 Tax=Synechococcus phage ACG-2014f TaxID=1493511 RepID=A0A0E3IA71_9CAUD|nr:baseplate tail tube cap [Synechococcus phage ACG-2014f]AIX28573.1 baseplate tail tube cap [Synechococcus phage ACG-2014f]AIX32207.1 baseplate tail tube cap [Synechococcus phage ACG-2014f]AIX45557.1 baseplate tail tube cap [Synechococcus phage ACG-2014f]